MARLSRFHAAGDADRFVVGAALARIVIARYLQRKPHTIHFDRRCPDCGGHHGKPRVRDSHGVELSISHSGRHVGLAVASAPVGLDVEDARSLGPTPEASAMHLLSPDERIAFDRLGAADRRGSLLTYWTRKEAILKATGQGLRIEPASLTVSAADLPPRVLAWPSDSEALGHATLVDLRSGASSLASVAVLADPPLRVIERSGSALLASVRGNREAAEAASRPGDHRRPP
jgi:4'-phosphopantetheinyl transferase